MSENIRPQVVPRNASNPLKIENALGRNLLPRIEGLMADAETSGKLTQAACYFRTLLNEVDHD